MDKKIKIHVTLDIKNKIVNDAELFGFIKKDGTVNKNAFLNELVINYSNVYQKNNECLRGAICSVLEDVCDLKEKEQICDRIIKVFNENEEYGVRKEVVNYTANEKAKNILELDVMANKLVFTSVSSYLFGLLISYFELPRYKREAAIFNDKMKLIETAINEKKVLKFTSDNSDSGKTFELYPYKLSIAKEETCNYLYGYNFEEKKVSVFRVSRIKGLYPKEETFIVDKSIMDDIGKSISLDSSTTEVAEQIIVRFTEEGKRKYKMITNNRPRLIKVQDGVYYLEAYILKAEEYLKRFGKEAEVIKPKELRDRLRDFHNEAYDVYK